ncbi:MAG: hypothetical protein KC668_05375 [Myxococcales bacterium]|nr:hypothetical protein [Myxococcales bacterium]
MAPQRPPRCARPTFGGTVLVLVLIAATASALSPVDAHAQSLTDAELALEWQVAFTAYDLVEPHGAFPRWGLRRQVSRTISIDVNASIDYVFDAYSNIDNHVGRHALLQRVVNHREYEADGAVVREFTAIENLPVGGLAVPINTHAQQRIYADDHYYETDSWTAPGVITHQLIAFEEVAPGVTRITEYLTFEAEFLLIDYTVTNGVSSHQATLTGMKAAIEAGEF